MVCAAGVGWMCSAVLCDRANNNGENSSRDFGCLEIAL